MRSLIFSSHFLVCAGKAEQGRAWMTACQGGLGKGAPGKGGMGVSHQGGGWSKVYDSKL